MSFDVERHVLASIAAAPILREPFAHCVIDGIFPPKFFEDILDHWPEETSWQPLGESGRVTDRAYGERRVVLMNDAGLARLDEPRRDFWRYRVGAWLFGLPLRAALLQKFRPQLAGTTYETEAEGTRGDALIVSDRTDYAIGPHTDAPHRVVSALFYLPEDAAFRSHGTSLYVPLNPALRCDGGPHYPFDMFRRVKTVEFMPNRLVVFPKSAACFHGVERVALPEIERRLLIYNVRRTASATLATTSSHSS